MRTVYTTMRPGVPLEVDDPEYLDLLRQGLLVPASASPTPPASGGPVGAQADMHIDKLPQQPMAGAADAAALKQSESDGAEVPK